LFVSDLEEKADDICISFTDDNKLGETAMSAGRNYSVGFRLEIWADKNLLKLYKQKCHLLPMGRWSPCNSTGWALPAWGAAPWQRP